MNNVIDSWKNEKVFKKQLELNRAQLNNQYPEHWLIFIQFLENFKHTNILDVGCGCGAYYELCKKHFPEIKYTGIDYSREAIDLAISTWNHNNFFVMDYRNLTTNFINEFDLIHMGAFLDVLPNGDEALEFILSLHPKNIYIARMKITESPSYKIIYRVYDEIDTYAYHHNKETIIKICNKYNYKINSFYDNVYLQKEGA